MQLTIDSKIRIPLDDLPRKVENELCAEFTHGNPKHYKLKRMNPFWAAKEAVEIKMFTLTDEELLLPRGGAPRIKKILTDAGINVEWKDQRTTGDPDAAGWCPKHYPAGIGEAGCTLWDHQAEMRDRVVPKQQGLARAPTGCITGDAMIGINRGGKGSQISLERLVCMYNGGTTSNRQWNPEIPTRVRAQMLDGTVRLVNLVDAYESGVKEVFEVRFDSGHVVTSTIDHRYLTADGWRRLSEIKVGDSVYVEPMHSDHHKLHSSTKHIAVHTVLSGVASITRVGMRQTYDLSLDDPHNFLANGVVVHNSGKTTAAIAMCEAIQLPTIVIVYDNGLRKQWIKRLTKELGLKRSDIGVIGSGKFQLKPITIAMQQTLAKCTPTKWLRINEFFGAVICDEVQRFAAKTFLQVINKFTAKYRIGISADECVAKGMLVTMADGSTLPIEDVCEGDFVATPMGPRVVLKTHDTGVQMTVEIHTPFTRLRCTRGTLVATSDGWVEPESASYVFSSCRNDGYDEKEDVHGMRQGAPLSLSDPVSHGVQAESVRRRRAEDAEAWASRVDRDSIRGDLRSLEVARRHHRMDRVLSTGTLELAQTYDLSIDGAECFFAGGVLVHNTRKDEKEFLIYDMFGSCLIDIPLQQLIDAGLVHDVEVRVHPSDFEAEWYVKARNSKKKSNPFSKEDSPDFNRLLEEMSTDEPRNRLIADLALAEVKRGHQTVLFSHRREHCLTLNGIGAKAGEMTGLMLGGPKDAVEFDRTIDRLKAGEIRWAAGTVQAVGQGLDIPTVSRGVACTPMTNNKQMWGQLRGRLCRIAPGKTDAVVYVVWDRKIYGVNALKNLIRWNNKVVVWDASIPPDSGGSQYISADAYLRKLKGNKSHAKTFNPQEKARIDSIFKSAN